MSEREEEEREHGLWLERQREEAVDPVCMLASLPEERPPLL